ncbi:MAG: hypothetical protein JSS81_05985 [Acidobacteria bacterium]|nr:hypothetical protein [Acidobacteriota bacterium]
MTKKMTKYEENRQLVETNVTQQMIHQNANAKKERALVMIGAIGAVNHIAAALSAQTMRGLQKIRDEKIFESLGFNRFDDFLNDSDLSPMTYRQFIDREKLLENEGDELFDVLNTLRMSQKQRRLLGSGNVQIDESKQTVLIITGENLEEDVEEISINDRTRLLQTLSALADQAAVLNQKTIRQKTQIERGERQVEELRKKLDDAQNKPGKVSLFDMTMSITLSIDAMAELVKKSSEIDKANGELLLNTIRAGLARLEQAYSRKPYGEMTDDEIKATVGKKVKKLAAGSEPDDDELADLTASMDEEDLAALMDD